MKDAVAAGSAGAVARAQQAEALGNGGEDGVGGEHKGLVTPTAQIAAGGPAAAYQRLLAHQQHKQQLQAHMLQQQSLVTEGEER